MWKQPIVRMQRMFSTRATWSWRSWFQGREWRAPNRSTWREWGWWRKLSSRSMAFCFLQPLSCSCWTWAQSWFPFLVCLKSVCQRIFKCCSYTMQKWTSTELVDSVQGCWHLVNLTSLPRLHRFAEGVCTIALSIAIGCILNILFCRFFECLFIFVCLQYTIHPWFTMATWSSIFRKRIFKCWPNIIEPYSRRKTVTRFHTIFHYYSRGRKYSRGCNKLQDNLCLFLVVEDRESKHHNILTLSYIQHISKKKLPYINDTPKQVNSPYGNV